MPPLVHPPDEIYTWPDSQIEGEIASVLPEGLDLVCSWEDGTWSVRVESIVGDETKILWVHEHLDRRMALFNAYTALWLKDQPTTPEDSPWSTRTPRPTRQSVTQYVRHRKPDPEDLDPQEVAAVYGVSSPKDGD